MLCSSDSNGIRGKYCTRLNLSGKSESNAKWHLAALKNLNADANTIERMGFKRVPVARHHWSLEQLNHYFGNGAKKRTSTPAPLR